MKTKYQTTGSNLKFQDQNTCNTILPLSYTTLKIQNYINILACCLSMVISSMLHQNPTLSWQFTTNKMWVNVKKG